MPLMRRKLPAAHLRAIHPLSDAEVTRLLKAAKGDRLEAMFHLALDSGARQGELFALHWDDTDLTKGSVRIWQAVPCASATGGVSIGPLETDNAARSIPITKTTVGALKRRKAIATQEGLSDNPYVFPTEKGLVLEKSNFLRKTWGPIRERARITKRFHDLRHTMATTLMRANIHPKVVQERLGHASIVLTLDTYSAFIPSMQIGAAAALEKRFRRLGRKKIVRNSHRLP